MNLFLFFLLLVATQASYAQNALKEAGAISVFKKIVFPEYSFEERLKADDEGISPYSTKTGITYYFAQKGNLCGLVFSRYYLDKKTRNTLRSFLDDDPEICSKLDDKNICSRKSFFKLIREYNVKHFIPPTAPDYSSSSNIGIYTRAATRLRSKVKITVNDSLEFTMPVGNYPLPVTLPNYVASKVCVTVESLSYCRTLSPCPSVVEYYETYITVGGKPVDLEYRNKEEYLSYLGKKHR